MIKREREIKDRFDVLLLIAQQEVIAWLVTYTSLLGYHADHAFIGLPRLSVVEQLAYFTRLDGLAFLGSEALVLGTIAFILGYLLQWGTKFLQKKRAATPNNDW